jgi:hypothetical protein
MSKPQGFRPAGLKKHRIGGKIDIGCELSREETHRRAVGDPTCLIISTEAPAILEKDSFYSLPCFLNKGKNIVICQANIIEI